MKFKSSRVKQDYSNGKMHRNLCLVFDDFIEEARAHNWDFTVTSIYRTPKEDKELKGSGIHTLWRAIDVRDTDVTVNTLQEIVAALSDKWVYDPERPGKPLCLYSAHGNGPHLHIQVHENTARRN